MIDIKIIRENPDLIRQALRNRNDNAPLDEIITIDERYRMSLQQVEALRAGGSGAPARRPRQLMEAEWAF